MTIWAGKTVVCIASGPSLNSKDCALIELSGLPCIAVNTSWEMARFCDVIYAGDVCWWIANKDRIDIDAERWTCTRQASQRFGVNLHKSCGEYNSGMRAIEFAMWRGATRVILLGYDCSLANGTHWHGDHKESGNPDEVKVRLWQKQFIAVSEKAKLAGVDVINCSRETDLRSFRRLDLEEAILIG